MRALPNLDFDLQKWCLITMVVLGAYCATLPLIMRAQMVIVGALLLAIIVAKKYFNSELPIKPHEDYFRIFIILCGIFITFRYLSWRTFNTINYHDPFSLVAALTLYLAELYGITIYLLGGFVNLSPLKRQPLALPPDQSQWPSVDVFIPTYNEDVTLLELTLIAATQIEYPSDKLTVYLLDDGGTEQKRSDADQQKSAAAWRRHQKLQLLCRKLGARYLTRERNEHAKAGNINEAMKHTHGELILILDADHVPTVDILVKTVGFFMREPKMFLVQTPHYFINPDPIEKNLETYTTMPGENEMFYSVVQHGLDFWNASFFCGSAAVLRRKHLESVGGISGETITEDAETALKLHGLGLKSAYLGIPMISGLQPETFSGFILQRVRWAQGMMQIFLLSNPWRSKTLTLWQKLSYTNSSFFWFFPFARTVFLIAPTAFLVLGLKIYDANMSQFVAYAFPHLLGAILVADFLYGKVRWTLISELYETMQSLFSLVAIFKVFINPRSPTFNVTPKGEQLEEDFVSSLYKPFYVLIIVGLVSLVAGIYRYVDVPTDRDVIVITSAWEIFNLILLIAALGALLERRQQRKSPRVPVSANLPAQLRLGDTVLSCVVQNLSALGAGITLPMPIDTTNLKAAKAQLKLEVAALRRTTALNVRIMRILPSASDGDSGQYLGLKFEPDNLKEQREIVALAFGNSALLIDNLRQRQRSIGIASGLGFLLKTGLVHGYDHLVFRVHQSAEFAYEYVKRLVLAPFSWRPIPATDIDLDDKELIDLSIYRESREQIVQDLADEPQEERGALDESRASDAELSQRRVQE